MESKPKKPFYKRWWFIVIVIVAVIGTIGNLASGDTKGTAPASLTDSQSPPSVSDELTPAENSESPYRNVSEAPFTETEHKEVISNEPSSPADESPESTYTKIVYVTPSGKRYHYSKACAGENAREIDISKVGSRSPCKTCAE